jgi:hypothetical protein
MYTSVYRGSISTVTTYVVTVFIRILCWAWSGDPPQLEDIIVIYRATTYPQFNDLEFTNTNLFLNSRSSSMIEW